MRHYVTIHQSVGWWYVAELTAQYAAQFQYGTVSCALLFNLKSRHSSLKGETYTLLLLENER